MRRLPTSGGPSSSAIARRKTGVLPNALWRHLLPEGEATVLAVKVELRGLSVSAFDVRVKAGAFAPPLTRLTALTRPPDADSVPPCNRRFPLNSGMGFQ